MWKKKISLFLCLIVLILSGNPAFSAQFSQNNQSTAYYSVINFGAKADGQTKDTRSVQDAIDSCYAHGGGTVYFPPGTYLCGSLHLKSNIALYLDHGALIKMSKDNEDFDPYEKLEFKTAGDKETSFFHYALIRGEDLEHIAILGTGIIDGNRVKRGGPKPIALKRCSYVTIRDITLKNAPNYNISMLGTDFVSISGVTILNGYSDGIDPDACKNIRISDCFIDCYDDAIVPKASFSLGIRRSVENLTVTNCILSSNCNAFKFGTESGGGFKNVTFSNSTILPRKIGRPADSGISLESVDGAEVEGVTITNIAMTTVKSPIFLRLGNRGRDMQTPTPGYLRNVIITNITATGALQASIIAGIPGFPVENFTLNNIKIEFVGGGSFDGKLESVPELIDKYPDSDMFGAIPAWGIYCRHAKNLRLESVDLTVDHPDKRSAFIFEDVAKLNIVDVAAERSEGASSLMYFKDIKQVVISRCQIPKNKSVFFNVPANQKNEIQLTGNSIIN